MSSLIQQRMSIDRQRTQGWVLFGFGAVLGALSLIEIAIDHDVSWFRWAGLVVMAGLALSGLRMRHQSERRRAAFEAEHGANAGKQ